MELLRGTKSREKQGDGAQTKHSKQKFKKEQRAFCRKTAKERAGRSRFEKF